MEKKRDFLEKAGTRPGKTILITGGQLSNLGVQALLFTTIEHLSRRFPDRDVYLLSYRDHLRPEAEKQAFTFTILPWDLEIKTELLWKRGRWLRPLRGRRYTSQGISRLRSLLEKTAFIIDISGFSLSSQWPFRVSVQYLLNIKIASRFRIPFYIFPQSFGPFDYSWIQKKMIFPYLRKLLPYPAKIFAREASSLAALKQFTQDNVSPLPCLDMVLLNREYDLNRIFIHPPSLDPPRIASPAAAIIPNLRVMERTHRNRMFHIYQDMIDVLLQQGKKVYLFSHTGEIDAPIAEKIMRDAEGKSGVFLIEKELDAVEIRVLIRGFEFIVAARYHAVVHAYKNGVPALVFGWSSKYNELLKTFDQSQYLTDIRTGLDSVSVLAKLDALLGRLPIEEQVIQAKMKELESLDNAPVYSAIEAR